MKTRSRGENEEQIEVSNVIKGEDRANGVLNTENGKMMVWVVGSLELKEAFIVIEMVDLDIICV